MVEGVLVPELGKGAEPVTPWYPLTVIGPVTVRPCGVVATTSIFRLEPTGTDPNATDAARSGAFAPAPKARRCPSRVPT
jgi:hypothetical protein